MATAELVDMLEAALREPLRLPELVPLIQSAVWHGQLGEGPIVELLRDLAYDLDFYEPDPRSRSEDPSFRSETEALSEIEQVLAKIRKLSAGGDQ